MATPSVPPIMEEQAQADEPRTCRNCLSDENPQDLIAPCNCKGSMKWVHRQCLDTWRAVSPKPASFTKCDYCLANYKLIVQNENRRCLKCKFIALVARDLLGVILAVNLLIVALGYLFDSLIKAETIVRAFPNLSFVMESPFLRVYCWGGLVFFFVLGIAGIIVFCWSKCCSDSNDAVSVTQSTYPYRSSCDGCVWIYCGPYYHPHYGYSYGPCGTWDCDCCCVICNSCCDCNCNCNSGSCDCNCNNSNSDCNGDCGVAILVIVVVVVVIIVLIGLFFGIFLLSLLVAKVTQRHLHVLERSHRAQIYKVANLEDPYEAEEAVDVSEIPELARYNDTREQNEGGQETESLLGNNLFKSADNINKSKVVDV